MTLTSIANIASSLSLIVAALTFIRSLLEKRREDRSKRVAEWQRIVVYKIIQGGTTNPRDIKSQYLEAAQQFSEFALPSREIQDGALQLALMSLVESHLVSYSDDGRYLLNVVSPREDEFKMLAVREIELRRLQSLLASRVYETLDADSGKYTIDQLYRNLGAETLGASFDEFNILVRSMTERGQVVLSPDQKLWLRTRVPQRSPAAPPQRPPNT